MRIFLLLISSMLFSFSVQADTVYPIGQCSYTMKEHIVTFPAAKISIDPGAPVGTLFYAYTVGIPDGSGTLTCSGKAIQVYQQDYTVQSGGTTTLLSGVGSFPANSTVYKTNIPGIGLIISKGSSKVLPIINSPATMSGGTIPVAFRYTSLSIDVNLVKYADIPAGVSYISLAGVPSVDVITKFVSGTSINTTTSVPMPINSPFILGRFHFGPSTIELLSATCDTPDVLVDLGKRNKTDSTNRDGTTFATPWVDASIKLTNCPVFNGVGGRSNATFGSVKSNVMTVTLMPNNATTSNQGIMPIDTDGYSAAGVGIQLAWGTASSNTKVNFSSGKGTKTYTLTSSIGTNYTLPLVARYIQTGASLNDVHPGKATGKMTYIVSYF